MRGTNLKNENTPSPLCFEAVKKCDESEKVNPQKAHLGSHLPNFNFPVQFTPMWEQIVEFSHGTLCLL